MRKSSCPPEQCDIFDFMARHVGLAVLHPGGLAATRRLAEDCGIHEGSHVLDVGCGKGTAAIYLSRETGCKVTGIDLSEDLVAQAASLARRAKLRHRAEFQVADAQSLPFPAGEFDVVVGQAVLVLVHNKPQVIQEAVRVTRPGGRVGWLELSWPQIPPPEFLQAVSDVLCAYCMQNVETFERWEDLFRGAGLVDLGVSRFALPPRRLGETLRDEGPRNTIAVMLRTLLRGPVRTRTRIMNRFFQTHADRFAYGIYVGQKPRT